LPKQKKFCETRGLYFSHGFFVDGTKNFQRRKGKMKTVWIGMMAATFVLGTGILALMYLVGKMVFSYVKSVS
jgi:hypothetical protein